MQRAGPLRFQRPQRAGAREDRPFRRERRRRPRRIWPPRFPPGISTGTVAAAAKNWSDVLGKIEIETSDPATRETFYTNLYHSCIAPTLFNDADGSYLGLDHKVHGPEGFQNYCTFSLWDTFRAEHPLLTIVQPQRVDDFVGTMLAHYRQFNQHALPVWSLAGNETWCMIGNHAIPVIADAYAKGFRRYDAEAVYQAMRDTVDAGPQFSERVSRTAATSPPRRPNGQAVGLADAGIRLRRLVRRADGQAARQEGRRRAVRQAGPELSERVRSGRSDSCAASSPTGRGASRSTRANSFGPTIPRPPRGITPGSCRRTCRA